MKKTISVLLALIMLITSVTVTSFSVFAITKLKDSGTVSGKVDYTFDSKTGALSVTGTGTIPFNAFKGFTVIKSVKIEGGITKIGDGAFDNCSNISSVKLNEGTKEIGNLKSVFGNCTALKSIVIPNSVTKISTSCFSGCTGLQKVTFGTGLDTIPSAMFKDFGNLKTVVIPEGVVKIGTNAFEGSGLTSVTIPGSVTTIESSAFYSCKQLKTLVVKSKGQTSIGGSAFDNCTKLSTVTLNSGVKRIGVLNSVFGNCYALKTVTIPSSVTYISSSCFKGCDENNLAIIFKGTSKEWQTIDVLSEGNRICDSFIVYCSNGAFGSKAIKSYKLKKTSFVYNGKVHKPGVTVTAKNGKTVSSSLYKVTYSKGLKNVGKYTVKITFKGCYSKYGSKKKTFVIKPKGTSVAKVTAKKKSLVVKWKKQAAQTTGYQIQYSTTAKFKKAKTVTVKKNKTTKATVKKLASKKKYYVRVRTYKTVGKTKYYSGWSKAKAVKTK